MIIEITVKTNAKKGPLLKETPRITGNQSIPTFTAYLNAKPHDGEANKALVELLSKYFKTGKTNIKILSGQKSHKKRVEIIA